MYEGASGPERFPPIKVQAVGAALKPANCHIRIQLDSPVLISHGREVRELGYVANVGDLIVAYAEVEEEKAITMPEKPLPVTPPEFQSNDEGFRLLYKTWSKRTQSLNRGYRSKVRANHTFT